MNEKHCIKGILLAGVHQWQSSVFETFIAKPLVPLVDRPLIRYPLRWMREGGIHEAVVCANSDTATIRRRLGRGDADRIELHYCEDVLPRGSAGCVRDAATQCEAQTLLVVDATIAPQQIDLGELLRTHRESGAALTIAVKSKGRLGDGREALIPLGVRVFDRRALAYVPEQGYQDINEALVPRLHAQEELIAIHPVTSEVPRVTDANSYLAACQWAVDCFIRDASTPPEYRRCGDSLVHESAFLDDGARLIGAVLVGPSSSIRSGATIVGPTVIGSDCLIDRRALICRSAVWDRNRIGEDSSLYRCIVLYDAQVAPHSSKRDQVLS